MTLCDDCIAAERDAHGIGVTHAGRLCCAARTIANAPRKLQRRWFDAVTADLAPLDAQAVRMRAHEIIRARRDRGVTA